MHPQLVVTIVMEALDGRFLDGAIWKYRGVTDTGATMNASGEECSAARVEATIYVCEKRR